LVKGLLFRDGEPVKVILFLENYKNNFFVCSLQTMKCFRSWCFWNVDRNLGAGATRLWHWFYRNDAVPASGTLILRNKFIFGFLGGDSSGRVVRSVFWAHH
jgi:hypothetical protein